MAGREKELIAKVFVAMENDLPAVKTAEQAQQEIIHDYQTKLIKKDQPKTGIPDAMTLPSDWLDEEFGVRY